MKRILMFIIIVALAFALLFSGVIPFTIFGDGEYHTGLTEDDVKNRETQHFKTACTKILGQELGCWYGNCEKDYEELIQAPFNNDPVVTSWKSGEESVTIVMQGSIQYLGTPTPSYWGADEGWYVVDYTSNGVTWKTILDTGEGTADKDYIGHVSGSMSRQKYTDRTGIGLPGFPWPVLEFNDIKPVSFNMKNPHVGALRIRQMSQFKSILGTKIVPTSEDYCFLISGEGDLRIVNQQTVYEEGQTITFEVDTYYSGQTQGGSESGNGWELRVYDADGSRVQTWDIADDQRNVKKSFTIPAGAYNPSGSNTWKVELWNTLFNQDEEYFFAIGEGMSEAMPGTPTITFNQEEYDKGDTVVVTFESEPNPKGRNTIDSFFVRIIYGTTGTNYVAGYPKHINAYNEQATVSFTPQFGDEYVTIKVNAFDAPENQGGIPSEMATESIWIKEEYDEPDQGINWLLIGICFVIALLIAVIAFAFVPGLPLKIIVTILGIVIAVLVYLVFSGGLPF